MGFLTENRTVLTIFQRSSVYKIPRYQRAYVWNEKNWSELLTDIDFTVNIDNVNWSHFLGAIVLNKIDNNLKDNQDPAILYFEIIDGQQRITTLFMIFNAIARRLLEINTEESKNRANYIHLTYISAMKSDSHKTPKIQNDDIQNDIKEIIDYSTDLDTNNLSTKNSLSQVYNYYLNYLSKKDFKETDEFLKKLLNINIVEIVSEQEEEIYNIFEVLNARGQKLKQMELLKNHIMKYVHPREDIYIDYAKKTWNAIYNRTEGIISDIDSLLVHFAKCYIKKKADNANSVYKLIKEEISITKLSNLLTDLEEFSKSYILVNEKESSDPSIEYFNIKRNTQVRSLLAAITLQESKGTISKQVKEDSIINIRNFFFLFNGMQKTSNRTDTMLTQCAYGIYNSTTSNEFKMHITELFVKLKKLINKEDFMSIMRNHQSFRYSNKEKSLKQNAKLVKYTLGEYYKYYQKDTILNVSEMSIEHLLNDNGEKETVSLGNLALVSPKVNSDKLKDNNINEKIDIIKRHSDFNNNKNLEEYLKENGYFDTISRGESIVEDLYENIFSFNPYQFGLNEEDVLKYFHYKDLLKNDEKLLELLKNHGKNFESKLEKDPGLQTEYKRFISLKA